MAIDIAAKKKLFLSFDCNINDNSKGPLDFKTSYLRF